MQDRRSSTAAVPPHPTLAPTERAQGKGDRWKLQASELELSLDPTELGFHTTDELEPLDHLHGQERAIRALEFGLAVRHRGYNIYVSGMTGTGKKQLIQELLTIRAGREATPDDWVYVHNFDEPDRPRALRLPSGHGMRLRGALEEVIARASHAHLGVVVPSVSTPSCLCEQTRRYPSFAREVIMQDLCLGNPLALPNVRPGMRFPSCTQTDRVPSVGTRTLLLVDRPQLPN